MKRVSLKQTLIDLLNQYHLLSAPIILEKLAAAGRRYNKTSVYRALDQLLSDGTICRHHFTPGEASYELREHHHAHLVCTSCGTIKTGDCDYHEPKQVDSFIVDHHHTTLFGTCLSCQVKTNDNL